MLSTIDRVILASSEPREAARPFEAFFGALVVGERASPALGGKGLVLRLGASEVELLRPTGPGPLADFAATWKGGLFAVGFATADLAAVERRLRERGVELRDDGGRLFVPPTATFGMPCVVAPSEAREAVGLVRTLYEVTNVVGDWRAAEARYADLFGLERSSFCPIRSDRWGYEGVLTLFHPRRLHRIEITQPWGDGAMARFHRRRGDGLYMCFAEADAIEPIAERLQRAGARFAWEDERDPSVGLFVHPSALSGMLMGVSRTHHAWTWSGHPEWAAAGPPPA